IENLNISLDWYQIEIEDGLATLAPTFLLDQCYVEGNAGFCQLIDDRVVRLPSGRITEFDLSPINIAETQFEAYDFTVQYRIPETAFGDFRLTWDSSYISKYDSRSVPTDDFDSLVGTYTADTPTWRLRSNANLDWSYGDFGASWTARYRSA